MASRPWCTGPCHIFVGVRDRFGTVPSAPTPDASINFLGSKDMAALADDMAEFAAQLASSAQLRRQQPAYLGTAEVSPDVEIRPVYVTVPTDASGGRRGPGEDQAYLGEEAIVSAVLTRWDYLTYAAISARPAAARGRGFIPEKGIGSLMCREGLAYPLWLYWPYFAKQTVTVPPLGVGPAGAAAGAALNLVFNAARVGSGMPPGLRFLRTYLVAPERIYPMGTRPKKISLVWRAQMEFRGAETRRVGGVTVNDPRRSGFILYDTWMKDLPDPDKS